MSSRKATLKVAVGQLTSIDHIPTNLATIMGYLAEAKKQAADLVCLPENALFLRMNNQESVEILRPESPELNELRAWAGDNKTAVHVGSVALEEQGKVYNSSILFRDTGEMEITYQKIHLFDVDVEGHRPVRESDVFAYGRRPSIFSLAGWRFGSSICYDLRFSELFQYYARQEVDAILIPAAFLVPTGRAHWDTMIRARAIESQAYVVAAAQGGVHHGTRSGGQHATFGHSMIVDPWGEVVLQCQQEKGPEMQIATMEIARIEKVRRQIPMRLHRRLGASLDKESV